MRSPIRTTVFKGGRTLRKHPSKTRDRYIARLHTCTSSNMHVWSCAHARDCRCGSVQVCIYAGVHLCRDARVKVCRCTHSDKNVGCSSWFHGFKTTSLSGDGSRNGELSVDVRVCPWKCREVCVEKAGSEKNRKRGRRGEDRRNC